MKELITSFLKDLTYSTKYEFLEEGKHKDELLEIGEKSGYKLPAHDLAVFKGRYAYVDRTNKNGTALPEAEVRASINTLKGKAVDFDHLRKKVVGHWIDAKLEGNEIVSYGVFYKGNFPEEYETLKSMMEKGTLKISFEAWGIKELRPDGDFNLTDIEFAGGALLINEDPAFDGAEVLEMSKTNEKVLEFAKFMKPPTEYVHQEVKKDSVEDVDDGIDFTLLNEDDEIFKKIIELEDSIKLNQGKVDYDTRNQLSDDKFAVVKTVKNQEGKSTKIRMFPIHENNHVRNALARLEIAKVQNTLQKLDVSVDSVKEKINKKSKEFNMDELIKRLQEASTDEDRLKIMTEIVKENASLKNQVKTSNEEVEEAKKTLAEATETLSKVKADLETASKERDEFKSKIDEIEKAKVEELLTARKEELGEFAKDLTDEQIQNDLVYENAKLKKELHEAKGQKTQKTETQKMEVASKTTIPDEIVQKAKRVDSYFLQQATYKKEEK